jgi:hypothetical protein
MKSLFASTFGMLVLAAGVVSAQSATAQNQPNQKNSTTFKGCLQGDSSKGFALLAATGDGSGADTKGQTITYKVVPAANMDLRRHVNKVVEITGTAAMEKAGSMPAPVPDTVRGTGGAGGSGKPGENTAFYYANGTLTAKTIREVSPTCAIRSAPDNDKKPR